VHTLASAVTLHVLGTPASLIGWELSSLLGSGPSLYPPRCPKPSSAAVPAAGAQYPTIWASLFWSTWPVWGGAMQGSVWGPGPLQYNQLRSPGRFWFPHPPPTGALLMYDPGRDHHCGSIRLLAYPSTTTRCRPPPRGVKGLRSHPRTSQRGIYARSCIRTSENSTSRHFGE